MSPVSITRRDAALAGISQLSFATTSRTASATPEAMGAAIRRFMGEASAQEGGMELDLPPLVDNGNSVTMKIAVESPMSEGDHVKRIAVFSEKNPQPNMGTFHLSPRSGRATIETRVRLADSQRVTAIAEMSDGSYRRASADVVVTLAACLEGG